MQFPMMPLAKRKRSVGWGGVQSGGGRREGVAHDQFPKHGFLSDWWSALLLLLRPSLAPDLAQSSPAQPSTASCNPSPVILRCQRPQLLPAYSCSRSLLSSPFFVLIYCKLWTWNKLLKDTNRSATNKQKQKDLKEMDTLINHCWGDGKKVPVMCRSPHSAWRGRTLLCSVSSLCTNSYLIILSSFVVFLVCVFIFGFMEPIKRWICWQCCETFLVPHGLKEKSLAC